MPISENLKYLMDLYHVTTAQLSAKTGVPESTITKIRSKVTLSPSMDTLQALAKGLNVSINDLVDHPSTADEEIRDLMPKNTKGVPEEFINAVFTTLRNQRLASDRTVAELRKDRNFWRKFAVICISVIVPMLAINMIVNLVMYWDLSHPLRGNIQFTSAEDISSAISNLL